MIQRPPHCCEVARHSVLPNGKFVVDMARVRYDVPGIARDVQRRSSFGNRSIRTPSRCYSMYVASPTGALDRREGLFNRDGPGVAAGMSMEKTRMDEEGWSGGRGGGEPGLTGS
jgi:hypothetical protein